MMVPHKRHKPNCLKSLFSCKIRKRFLFGLQKVRFFEEKLFDVGSSRTAATLSEGAHVAPEVRFFWKGRSKKSKKIQRLSYSSYDKPLDETMVNTHLALQQQFWNNVNLEFESFSSLGNRGLPAKNC